jgi:HD superfamily phosphohydrolase
MLVEHANTNIDAHALGGLQPEMVVATATEKYQVVLAALCHDLGHGPFSHLFEKWLHGINVSWCVSVFP